MCGIAGYASLDHDSRIDPFFIRPMIESLVHRGPDDFGTATFDRVALANSRLSIIDLAGGHQPLENEDGTVVTVYNGEIYNFPELRGELLARGHRFRTHSDTEVIVHLYEEEGPQFLARLNGMFSLALYDRRQDLLLVARDRYGIKPLFYSVNRGIFSFASEIKALRLLPGFDSELDPEGLSVFLGLFFIPDPWTIYRRVRRLRPGYYLQIDREDVSERAYCRPGPFGPKKRPGAEAAREELAGLLRRAVKRQLISDVPVAVLLSGGLDSRSVLAAAVEEDPGTASFTITFDEGAFNEGGQAAYWAGLYRSRHLPMLFGEEDFFHRLLPRQRHLDEPFGLWCNVAMGALAGFVHENGYKVVLSGEGGDELFYGYPTVNAAWAAGYYRRLIPRILHERLVLPGVRRLPAGSGSLPFSFKLKSFAEAVDYSSIFRTFFSFKEVVRYSTWKRLLTPEVFARIGQIDPFIAHSQYLDEVRELDISEAMAYMDFKVFLPGCVFQSGDNAFMSASVEQRVPMLDNDLVDFAFSLPLEDKFHPLKLKPLLKQTLERYFAPPGGLPVERYQKRGFEVPGNIWLNQEKLQRLVRGILSKKNLDSTGFFQPAAVERILEDQLSHNSNNERVVQALVSLQLFLDGHYDPDRYLRMI